MLFVRQSDEDETLTRQSAHLSTARPLPHRTFSPRAGLERTATRLHR